MKKLIIVSIIAFLPLTAGAAQITPGPDYSNGCTQSTAYTNASGFQTGSPPKGICYEEQNQSRRLHDLEVAVQALQVRNAQLEANNGATGAVPVSLEARVSALEKVTKSIQDSLVMVVNMLAQALSSLKH